MKKGKIGIDMDWVLAKLTKKWVNTYNVIFNDDLKIDDIKSWNIIDYVKPEAKDYILNILNLPNFYRDLEVVDDSQRVIKKLSESYELFIVTDPFKKASYVSKHEWLGESFDMIDPRNYIFTGNKSIVNVDFLIDDGVHNFEGFNGIPILFDAPYNQGDDRYYRVKNWQDIEHLFDHKMDELLDFYKKNPIG